MLLFFQQLATERLLWDLGSGLACVHIALHHSTRWRFLLLWRYRVFFWFFPWLRVWCLLACTRAHQYERKLALTSLVVAAWMRILTRLFFKPQANVVTEIYLLPIAQKFDRNLGCSNVFPWYPGQDFISFFYLHLHGGAYEISGGSHGS
jgi:hypothetical protein